MKDEKEMLGCDECQGKLIKDFIRDETYCEKCGLIRNGGHPMGHNKNDLINYAIHEGLQNRIDEIKIICNMYNLRDARLTISKMVLNK